MEEKKFVASKKATGYIIGLVSIMGTGAIAGMTGVPVALIFPKVLESILALTGIYIGSQGIQDAANKIINKDLPK